MEIRYFNRAVDFLSDTVGLFQKDEARYGLILGIAKRLVKDTHAYGKVAPWFCVVTDNRKIVAVAMRTPPHNVLLAHFDCNPDKVAAFLADSISKRLEIIPGVVGDKVIAEPFAEYWCAGYGIQNKGKMAERIYRLDKINDVAYAAGKLRTATLNDEEILTKWIRAFYIDVFHTVNSRRPVDEVATLVGRKEIYVWEDGVPVSMAAKTRPTENGISVGLVYTPEEFRQKGYGTSCVAALCKELLDSGYKFCSLYADLANPISNSIYKKIGFKEVSDSVEYSFTTPFS